MQILRIKHRRKRLLHQLRIRHPEPSRHNRSYVPQNPLPNLVRKLRHKLICQKQIQPIFPRLTKNRLETLRRKILKLIYKETEIFPFILWNIRPAHRRLLELHHQNHTQQVRVNIPQLPFRQVHQENLLLVHNLPDIKPALRLPKNVPHNRIREERPPFRREPRYNLPRVITFLRSRKFLRPVIIHRLILHIFQLTLHKLRIRETLRNINKCRPIRVCH